MNKDNAKDFLPLVQALAEGKTIQVCSNSGWADCLYPRFDSEPHDYRIKPEPPKPREWDFWVGESGTLTNMDMTEFPNWKKIRVREVLEGEQ